MAAGKYNLLIEQGSKFLIILDIVDSSDVAIDITGFTFAGQIRAKYDSANPVIGTFSFNILDQSGADRGKVEMSMTATQTAALAVEPANDNNRPLTEYLYDVEMTTSPGIIERVLEGKALVSPEVTK